MRDKEMRQQQRFEYSLRNFCVLANGEEQFGGLPSRRLSSDEFIWQIRM